MAWRNGENKLLLARGAHIMMCLSLTVTHLIKKKPEETLNLNFTGTYVEFTDFAFLKFENEKLKFKSRSNSTGSSVSVNSLF
jgi:hypothetical protein